MRRSEDSSRAINRRRTRLHVRRRVPEPVRRLMATLSRAGYQAHLVGGSVRDLVLGREPEDWDVATDATPDAVRRLFGRTVPTGLAFGTVTVLMDDLPIEVTTYRREARYSDRRHPDDVLYTDRVEDDLARRDFTVNAMAVSAGGQLVDPLGGRQDLHARVLRAVGEPRERFDEDPLRLLRAVRFAAQLGFSIQRETYEAAGEQAPLIRYIAAERVHDELERLLLADHAAFGFALLLDTGLLGYLMPELLEGVYFPQNTHHKYDVWEHGLLAMEATPPELHLRLAALLHDVAKPRCLSVDGDGKRRFFHHEVVGAAMARRMLRRLRFQNEMVDAVEHLVRHHLALHYYPDMTDAAVRRLIRRVGLANLKDLRDLLILRGADRLASGTKKGPVSRGTKRLLKRIEAVLVEDAAFGLRDLAVDGHDVMEAAGIPPGPAVGRILAELMERVLDEPSLNEAEILRRLIPQLAGALTEEPGSAGSGPLGPGGPCGEGGP